MELRSGTAAAGRAARAAAALLLAGSLAGCTGWTDRDGRGDAGDAPGDGREVPMRIVEQDGRILAFVPVSIAGEGPFLFALDTGASTSVVDTDVAEGVGLPRTGEERSVSGILGTGEVPVAEVERWEVGGVALDPGEVTVVDLGPPRGGGGIQGLLGSDVLSDFGTITVDYDEGVLTLPAP
ncbi:retropepsin-like aspartic protease [Streptomyces aidingensis]|uniref:Aspartyl protease n=1 Tax=Streptomyces aidingensis TaxID=910347 RepID=A0A1I1P9W6_9ACTN|nr:retropepsin-like aspartic protease [Streptomyces aidingensis]SFD06627.1 Aspartyl protease [Streptomyces aidingensis]